MSKLKKARNRADEIVAGGLIEMQSTGSDFRSFFVRSRNREKHGKRLAMVGYVVIGLMLGLLLAFATSQVVFATDPGTEMFARANTAMAGVLRQVRIISSIVAGLFLTIAFLLKMFSKNQRTVDEANTWIKRILIAWACINAIGFLLTFVQEIIGPDVELPTIGG